MRARITWVGVIVGLLGFSVITQAVLIISSLSDPSFAVEPDYEARAANWNEVQQQQAENSRLDWTLNVLTAPAEESGQIVVTVHLFDRWGKPITEASVRGTAFHNARAAHLVEFHAPYVDGARYQTVMPAHMGGRWEFRFDVTHDGARFTATAPVLVRVH